MLRLVRMSMRPYRQGSIRFYNHRCIHSSTFMYSRDSDGLTDINSDVMDSRMKSLETQTEDTKTEIENLRMDIKTSNKKITHKIEMLGQRFEATQREIALRFEHRFDMIQKESGQQFQVFAADLQKQLGQFFARAFFGVLGIAGLLIGGAWVLPIKENERMDAEIKKRAIIKEGVNKVLKE